MTKTRDQNETAEIDVLRAARDWMARDGKVAVATVVDTWGSAPVPTGGQMVVAADGRFQGSVSGGCIEGEVIVEAEDILESGKPKLLTFGVADETAWRAGLPCGGQVQVFVERLDAAGIGKTLLEKAVKAREGRQGLVVRTDLASGAKQLYERDDAGMPDDIADRFSTAKSQLKETPAGKEFLHALVPPARILVIGATHIGQALSEMAKIAGYEVEVIDPRTAFAAPDRFAGVKIHTEWPQDILPNVGLDPYSALVALSHVGHIDDEALKLAVRSPCLYIGALGSSRNHAKRRERLTAAGITADEIARIKSPIGLDIGAQTPQEIAVSVLAEVILAVRGTKRAKAKAAA